MTQDLQALRAKMVLRETKVTQALPDLKDRRVSKAKQAIRDLKEIQALRD